MNLRPLADRLIIAAGKKEEVTASGLVLPDTASKERPEQGEVIAVGPGRFDEDGERIPMSVKVGDTIVFKKYSPDEVKVGDKEYLVISEADVLAVIEK
jgi:chaperonin GroES